MTDSLSSSLLKSDGSDLYTESKEREFNNNYKYYEKYWGFI